VVGRRRTCCELNEVCCANVLLFGEAAELGAEALQASVFGVRALVGKDQAAITRYEAVSNGSRERARRDRRTSIEAVMECSPDGSPCRISALAIREELGSKGSGYLRPYCGARFYFLLSEQRAQ